MRGWRPALLLVPVLGAGLAWIGLCRAPEPDSDLPPGRWRTVEDHAIAALEAIGYADGTEPASPVTGVTVHDRALAWPGLNLYTSGHAQAAFLVDMDGREVHRWSYAFADAFPDEPPELLPEEGRQRDRRERWRRVHVYPDGDLLAIYEGYGLLRLDRDSRLEWAVPNRAHHDLFVGEDGRIHVLVRTARVVEGFRDEPVLEDFVQVLDPEGKELDRVSILDALRRSDHAALLDRAPAHGDVLHTNTLALLDGAGADRAPFLAAGGWLLSFPYLGAIAVLDPARRSVVWSLAGPWEFQHEPTVLPSGSLLLFDNRGEDGWSKVVEIDPVTSEVRWAWRGSAANGFRSRTCGTAARLPNGNTLVTESDHGRAFELTPDGRIVWQFHNPARAGARGELVATLFELVRLPADYGEAWVVSPSR